MAEQKSVDYHQFSKESRTNGKPVRAPKENKKRHRSKRDGDAFDWMDATDAEEKNQTSE
jgi:hypothetical protein